MEVLFHSPLDEEAKEIIGHEYLTYYLCRPKSLASS